MEPCRITRLAAPRRRSQRSITSYFGAANRADAPAHGPAAIMTAPAGKCRPRSQARIHDYFGVQVRGAEAEASDGAAMTTVRSGGPRGTVDDAGATVTGARFAMQSAVGGVPQASVVPPSVARALPAVYLAPMDDYWFARYLTFLGSQN